MTYAYRKAEESDREAIYQLYRLAMRDLIAGIWGWDEPWQRQDFSDHFDHHGIALACHEYELAGYSHIENRNDGLFIRMLAVHPGHRRNGIATRLLASVIASAEVQSIGVGLEVFKTNDVARALYERHGFKVAGETPESYFMIHA